MRETDLTNAKLKGENGLLAEQFAGAVITGATLPADIEKGLPETLRTVEEAAKNVPTQTVGDPGDFGRAVAFLCSDAAKFITGTGLLIDGGQSGYLL